MSSASDAEVQTWLGALGIGLGDMVEPQFRALHVERGQKNLWRALDADPSAPLVVNAAVRWLPSAAGRSAALTAGLVKAHPATGARGGRARPRRGFRRRRPRRRVNR